MKKIKKGLKKIFKVENILIALLIVTLLISIILGVISYYYGNLELFINYSGAVIGSILGVGGAYYVLKLQLHEDNKRELREKEPYIIVAETNIEDFSFSMNREDLSDVPTYTIPLVNAGSTPVYDISYQYEFVDTKEIITENIDIFDKDQKLKKFPTVEFSEEKKVFITRPDLFDKPPKGYDEDVNEMDVPNRYYLHFSNRFLDYDHYSLEESFNTAVIQAGDTYQLVIPEFAIVLWKYQLYNEALKVKHMRSSTELYLNDLLLKITYKNYRHDDKVGKIIISFDHDAIDPRRDYVNIRLVPIEQTIEDANLDKK